MRDFDNDMDELTQKAFEIMWKGIGLVVIIGGTALLLALICYK